MTGNRMQRGERRGQARARWFAASPFALLLAACGGGGAGPQPIAAPPPAPTPVPTPVPTPTPTPSATFNTAEVRRSDGANYHGAITAWQSGATGQGVVAGVIDSGIDIDSPEFAGRIAPQSFDATGAGRTIDGEGDHGTQVGQILLGAKDDRGTAGIAYGATLLVLRADRAGTCATEDPANDESGCRYPETAMAAGLDRAVSAGARVVNISLGGGDAAGATLRGAVARATAAGVIVVVSAGNSGDTTANGNDPTNPESFARSLVEAGGGLVIIVGSVDEKGAASDFSNKAGASAASYLSALGEGVCCVYENGAIKTESDATGTFVFTLNGTSFAAPQVSGAIALIAQAYPTLTPAQIVSLLYQSARDAGAAGDDAIYGQGILDIARAFQPVGAAALAGGDTRVALGGAAPGIALIPGGLGTLGPAMGDAGGSQAIAASITDGFGRPFAVDLGGGLAARPADARLHALLGGDARLARAAGRTTSLSLTLAPDATGGPPAWQAQRFAPGTDRGSRALAAALLTRLDARTTLGIAAGQGSGALAAGLRPAGGARGLIMGDAADSSRPWAVAGGWGALIQHDLGAAGTLMLRAERGQASDPRRFDDPARRLTPDRAAPVETLTLGWARRWGLLTLDLAGGWTREERSVLGAHLAPALGGGGATSLTADVRGVAALGDGWTLAAAWRGVATRADAGGLVRGGRLRADAWSLDLSRDHLLTPGDQVAVRLAQPLRVARGGLDLALPGGWDAARVAPTLTTQRYGLVPSGREWVVEAAYGRPLAGGMLLLNSWWRRDPGHVAAAGDDLGGTLRFTLGF